MSTRAARYRGALIGLAVGDAVGTTLEFKPYGSFEPIGDMVGGGPFNLPAGAWTDDTSMALCLADSLLERRCFDPIDQLQRYVRWYRDGHRSSIPGKCVDIGGSTSRALAAFERDGEPFPGRDETTGAGNGPLMKLAPVPMAYARHPEAAQRRATLMAETTHGAPQAASAARWMTALLLDAFDGIDRERLLDGSVAVEGLHPEIESIAAGSYIDKEPPEIVGCGYVSLALEAALWAVHRNDDFRSTILAAANLGRDADTTAAIAGQIAGAIYGVDDIPAAWRERVILGEEIVGLADALLALSEEIDPAAEEWDAG